MADNTEYLITQDIYNQLKLYEDDKNGTPFWTLSDNEVKYYKWLFSKDEYSKLRNSARQKLGI